ncbi:MAG TPA: CHRD domain-containing protein [Candidatus Sulfomarinibacteraceae bacterium]|nr:CHRD domain-containing protein [Candidatus Sulfomarinibacteraceae bacterium]
MSKTRRIAPILLTVLLSLLLASVVAAAGHAPVSNYRAHLTGDEEVPAVNTNAQGQAIFQFDHREGALHYRLIVANIEEVFAAHIHCGEAGVNGPVGVTLFGGSTTSDSGVLATGSPTEPNPGNACGWQTLADVQAAIDAGAAYVNVHTTANPGGEIRGQIH